ncbi:MAG: ribonuclease HII [Clostridiales bacterium]|nr:ribonuclease HII [Clostridiales bacterium]
MKIYVPQLEYENKHFELGCRYIAGVDEVGRGPLAGPVVCASVIMNLDDIIEGVTDSKKVSEKKREMLFDVIKEKAISYCISEISPEEIDEINILNATKKCMINSIKGLSVTPDVVLVDAVNLDVDVKTEPIIKGDLKSYTIGAASILAKVYRDRLMKEYAKEFPKYGFDRNAGYGTKEHIDMIKEIGPCKIHRRTFIKNFWG